MSLEPNENGFNVSTQERERVVLNVIYDYKTDFTVYFLKQKQHKMHTNAKTDLNQLFQHK